MKPMAVVTTHPIQYQGPLYRYLASHGVPVVVFFLNDQGLHTRYDPGFGTEMAWDISLTDGYEHRFVANYSHLNVDSFFGLVNPSLAKELSPVRYSAVLVHGWRSLSMLLALGTAFVRDLPVLYRSETPDPPDTKARLVGPLLRRLVSACMPIGTRNERFYRALGFPDDRLFTAPYAVDNERFGAFVATTSRREARGVLGLPIEGLIVLFSGKLVPWKQPDLLMRAFNRLDGFDAHLVYVGDGRMRGELERQVIPKLRDRVHFLGFMNQSRISFAYRASDLLVLPSSHEPWGLVVNEAMNFSVPAIVSDRVGCAPDLIRPGVTGEVFPFDSEMALFRSLDRVLSGPALLRSQGAAALEAVSGWGFPQCAAAFHRALQTVGNPK